MIRAKPRPPLVVQSKSRVLAWLASEATSPALRTKIAETAGVDEKTLRLAAKDRWNPTAETLAKLEEIIPHDWQPEGKRARAA